MQEQIGGQRDTLDAFVYAITEERDAVEVLYRLAGHVAHLLGAAGAGVSLADANGVLHATTAINQLSTRLEDAESRYGQGPCMEAFATRSVVKVDDLDSRATEWPDWNREARRHGVRAVVGLPIHARGVWLGAVNAYGTTASNWDTDRQRRLRLLTGLTASHLLHLSEMQKSLERAEQLQHALDSRVVIEQAKGILANDYDCTVDEAFVVLRHFARGQRASLRSVAHAIVHEGLRLPRRG